MSNPARASRDPRILQAAILVFVGFWVFWPSLHGAWLWDDGIYITDNPLLRDPSALWKIWFEPGGVNYFPVTATVQWFQWQLWQGDPTGYHATNIVLHLLSALLLWRLFSKLGIRLAWLGGLLFAVHPLTVESVAWVSELKNTLSLPLLVLSALAFVEYDDRKYEVRSTKYENGNPTSYFILLTSYFLFLASMLSKSTGAMFPFVILLYAWCKRGKVAAGDIKASAPFFAVSLALGLSAIWFEHHRAIGPGEIMPTFDAASRVAGAGLAVAFYFLKCILPVGLVPIYPSWPIDPPSFAQFLAWPAIGLLLFWLWTKRATFGRAALLGFGFFLLNLAPILGFVRMAYQRLSWVADHFAYLPLVGLVGLAAAGISYASTKYEVRSMQSEPNASRFVLRTSCFILGLIVLSLAVDSHRYAGIFKDQQTMWRYTVELNPDAWLAHNNLGNILQEKGSIPAAITQYEATLRLNPTYAPAEYNLAGALAQAGQLEEAADRYRDALRLAPDADVYVNYGTVLAQLGRLPEAISEFQEALRLQPNSADIHNNLGIALAQSGRMPEAIAQFEDALRLNPDLPDGHMNLGNALQEEGRTSEANAQFEQAARLQQKHP